MKKGSQKSSIEDISKALFVTNPSSITVREELPRIRKEMGEVEKLLESIKRFGQLQPVVVNRNMELIAGGRRLAACALGGLEVVCCFSDTVDPIVMREMELEENLQRKSLSPAEEVLAIEEIHTLKRKIYGEAKQGVEGGWGVEDTAGIMGKTKSAVSQDLALAEAVRMFPSLKEAKSKSDIKKAMNGLKKLTDRMDATSTYEKMIEKQVEVPYTAKNCSAEELLPTLQDGSFDILLTDPPYGIDISNTAISIGGVTGGTLTQSGYKYEDDKEVSLEKYALLAVQSYRIIKSNGHAFVFVAPEHFHMVSLMFQAAGWLVYIRPIIWIKKESGQNNAPHAWPSAGYEMILYARKAESRMVSEGKVDWIDAQPVLPSQRLHDAEKPEDLIRDLLYRVSLPGQSVLDPFMGSGVVLAVATKMKLFSTGCDILKEAYASALHRLINIKE